MDHLVLYAGIKEIEQMGDSFPATWSVLMLLLAADGSGEALLGRWAGDPVAVIGTAQQPGDIPGWRFDPEDSVWKRCYGKEGPRWTDVAPMGFGIYRHVAGPWRWEEIRKRSPDVPAPDPTPETLAALTAEPRLVVNLDRREYLDPVQLGEAPNLLAIMQGVYCAGTLLYLAILGPDPHGHGKLFIDHPFISRWCGQRQAVTTDVAYQGLPDNATTQIDFTDMSAMAREALPAPHPDDLVNL